VIVLNFSHPLTPEQLEKIEDLTSQKISVVKEIPVSFENMGSFVPQVKALADECALTPEEWQTQEILIVPPSLNFIAVTLIAELHGRMGYFPPIVRIRPVEGAVPPKFEVAEIIDLQAVRDRARKERHP